MHSLAIVVLSLFGLAALAWVAGPLLRAGAAGAGGRSDEFARARELESRHQQLLASLRDLEDDHTTDKVDENDYAEMRARLSAEAIEVMRQMDALKEEREAVAEAVRKGALPLRPHGSGRPGPRS